MDQSDYVRDAVDTVVAHARVKITERTRQHLARLSEDQVFIAQFPMVYACQNLEGKAMRYTVSLTIGDTEAQWVGKVWADGEYPVSYTHLDVYKRQLQRGGAEALPAA